MGFGDLHSYKDSIKLNLRMTWTFGSRPDAAKGCDDIRVAKSDQVDPAVN